MSEFSDENFLYQYFHYYLHHMYPDPLRNMFCDGFEERLDPDYLCDAVYALAERLGYTLVDGMWVKIWVL